MIKISFDIGIKGGYCISDKQKLIKCGKINTSSLKGMKLLKKLIIEENIEEVIFERPFAIVGNRNFNTLVNYGRIQAVPMMLGVEFVEVLPKTWISFYKTIGSDKKKHSKKAIQILNKEKENHNIDLMKDMDLMKEDGVADAILIANYCRIFSKYS